MTNEFFAGANRGMSKKHEGLKVTGVKNHVGHATPVGLISSCFHFGVFQVAFYHQIVLSPRYLPFKIILIKNSAGNQNKNSHPGNLSEGVKKSLFPSLRPEGGQASEVLECAHLGHG